MNRHRGFHSCGLCTAWKELQRAYNEGRQLEAVLEGKRITRNEMENLGKTPPSEHQHPPVCQVGVFVRGQWRQLGEGI